MNRQRYVSTTGPTMIALALLASGLVACQPPAADRAGGDLPPTTLTLATSESDPSEVTPFADAVRRLSNGSLVIDIRTSWGTGQAAYETALIQDVIAGEADLGVAGVRAFDEDGLGVTAFQGFLAPFLIDSYELQEQVLASEVADATLAGVEGLGLTGIGFDPGYLRRPLGMERQLAVASDFDGANVGAREGQVAAITFAVLGGTATTFVPNQASGLDGMEAHIALIERAGYDEGAESLTSNTVLWPRVSLLFANSDAVAGLTEDQRDVLREAATAARPQRMAEIAVEEEEALAILCRRGLQLVTVDQSDADQLRGAVASVHDQIAQDPLAARVIEEARRLSSAMSVESGPPLTCDGASATPEPGQATPIDGTWQACVTWEELAAAGADAGENNPDNLGCFVLEMERGDFWVYRPGADRESGQATFNSNGTYTLTEEEQGITFHLDDGELFTYRWSLFNDTLSFQRAGLVSPTNLVVKPLTRYAD